MQEIFEKEMRDKIVIKTEWHPKCAYRGEINGLRYSSDIPSVLPAELAMMKNPAANKLFQLKFAQKQLLSFDYHNESAGLKEEHKTGTFKNCNRRRSQMLSHFVFARNRNS